MGDADRSQVVKEPKIEEPGFTLQEKFWSLAIFVALLAVISHYAFHWPG